MGLLLGIAANKSVAVCLSSDLINNVIQILTDTKDSIETEGHYFSMLIEANSQYLFCYITK